MKKSIIKLLGMALVVTSITLLTTNSQAEENKPQVRRPKPSFFEQERKPRFGFGDFLNSALDGSDNFLSADNSVKTLLANTNPLYKPSTEGFLTVESRNENSDNFLRTTLQARTLRGGLVTKFTLNNAQYGSDPRVGTIDASFPGIPGVTTFEYRGSFSVNGDLVSGAVLLINPNNPKESYFIQLPARNIPNVNDENTEISAPVSFSIGLPSDR